MGRGGGGGGVLVMIVLCPGHCYYYMFAVFKEGKFVSVLRKYIFHIICSHLVILSIVFTHFPSLALQQNLEQHVFDVVLILHSWVNMSVVLLRNGFII